MAPKSVPKGTIDLGGGVWHHDPANATVPPKATFHIDCPHCHQTLGFERDPADWPNHPDGVEVVVECPHCDTKFSTDGMTAKEYVEALFDQVRAEVAEETARRLNGGAVIQIKGADRADSGDTAKKS